MPRIVEHMSVEELGARYRGAQDVTEARHTQVMEGAVLIVGRAGEAQPHVEFPAQFDAQGRRQPRLADAGLTQDQYHLPLAALGLAPPVERRVSLPL